MERRLIGLTASVVVTTLIGFAGGQNASVRVASPADLILQPHSGEDFGDVAFDVSAGVAKADVSIAGVSWPFDWPSPKQANAPKRVEVSIGPCDRGLRDLPGETLPLVYEAYDAAGSRMLRESRTLTLGPDTTKPVVRIVPATGSPVVHPGDRLEFVITGEESRDGPTWQTGIRRLTLADPVARLTQPISNEPSACDRKQWKGQHTFYYNVPRDARGGQPIALTAAAEDWAGNIGFAPLDLIVQEGYAGVWTTKGRFVGRNTDLPFTSVAVFSFMLNPRSGAVMCGTPPDMACGSVRVTYYPGHAGKCSVLRNPSSGVARIRVGGVVQGDKLAFLTMVPIERTRAEYRFACPGGQSNGAGFSDAPVGSIQPEGLTLSLPVQNTATFVKSEAAITNNSGFEVEHRVEIYAPRPNR